MATAGTDTFPIIARKVQVDFGPLPSDHQPLAWYDNDAVLTEVFHALSITFPAGETFFIDTIMRYGQVLRTKHPQLWEQVLLFIKQEAAHTHIHEQWNDRIAAEFGHPMRQIELQIETTLKEAQGRLPLMNQLAVVACLEHFTATLGRLLLDSPGGRMVLAKSQEPYRSLWLWHGLEELEHKKVAFDVYRALGGTYFRRALTMCFVAPTFLARTIRIWWLLMCRREKSWSRRLVAVGRLVYFFFVSPGMIRSAIPYLLMWYNPWFDPADEDAHDKVIVQEYTRELEAKRVLVPETRKTQLRRRRKRQQQQQQQMVRRGQGVSPATGSTPPVEDDVMHDELEVGDDDDDDDYGGIRLFFGPSSLVMPAGGVANVAAASYSLAAAPQQLLLAPSSAKL